MKRITALLIFLAVTSISYAQSNKKPSKPSEKPTAAKIDSTSVPKFTLTLQESELGAIMNFIQVSKQLIQFSSAPNVSPLQVSQLTMTVDTIPAYIQKKYAEYQKIYPPKVIPVKN